MTLLPPGDKWNQVRLRLGRRNAPFKIVMEAERSYSSFGDIAIDDLSFSYCSFPKPQKTCYSSQHQCLNRACVSSNRACDMTDDCGDNSDEVSNCALYTRFAFDVYFEEFYSGFFREDLAFCITY